MVTTLDYAKLEEEARWLLKHPEFEERPATIEEFLGSDYLNIYSMVRPGLRQALIEIFGTATNSHRMSPYERAMVTGAIGIGKTTFASIALPYMAHWVLCLRDPQGFFDLLPGSRIAFMQMSTSEQQAREVVFGDIFARIDHSVWFGKYPRDMRFTKQIRFPKDIWILPGDSRETTFEGYNILGGILDEMDSHAVTKERDYAEIGYDTIHSRISSRFVDPLTQGHRGLLILIGQMKKKSGFANRMYEEFLEDSRAHVTRMTIWESLGWERFTRDGVRQSFWYDPKRKEIIPSEVVKHLDTNSHLVEIPLAYLKDFTKNPSKALKDLAGIPPLVEDAFISLHDRVEQCVARWIDKHGNESPVTANNRRPEFREWFRANADPRKRVMHVDLATSGNGDALGMAMGHVSEIVEEDGEIKPYITIDFMLRIKAPGNSEILLSDVRKIIYHVRDTLGFRLKIVTFDGFESTDTMQQMRKKRFQADYLSVDRSTLPYEDLRDAIYERRIEFPPYLTYLMNGDTTAVQVALKELFELQDTGKKIDHPTNGSKDLADCLAGVCTTLMGDRTYHRRVSSGSTVPVSTPPAPSGGMTFPSDPFAQANLPNRLAPGSMVNPFDVLLPQRLKSR